MLQQITENVQVYIVTGRTDMRKGIDGLAAMVAGKYQLDPYSKALFLFCGNNRSKIKGLIWEDDGFLLLSKRLDNGYYTWPRKESEVKELTPQQIRWLLEGLSIEQKQNIKPGVKGLLY